MTEHWREILYPLGFLSSFAFTLRFLIQWITSEMRKESVVTPLFWKISLLGNVMLMIHSMIQSQFHVCIVQAGNAVISWRNLNLMQPLAKRWQTSSTLLLMAVCLALSSSLFILQALFSGPLEWFRTPVFMHFNHVRSESTLGWHFFGLAGIMLFNSRFWVQWWCAEKEEASYLGPSFWWISLVGDLMCLAYFLTLADPVNLLGAFFGLIPYIRNLMLIYKPSHSPKSKDALQ